MFENSLNYFGRKSRNNSAASKQSIEEKSPANRLSNTWNTDAVWTTESDDELSKDLKKAPSITSLSANSLKSLSKSLSQSQNDLFYQEAMITSKVMKENDPMVANLELIKSLRNGDFSGASKALSKGGDPDSTVEDGNDLFTLTHLAAKNGFSICLSLLISRNANISSKTLHGWEPLHLAAYQGHFDCLSILLKSNANVNAQNNYGQTPLMMAVGENHTHCVEELLRWNADETILTLKKKTAADLIKSPEIKETMLTKGGRVELHGKLKLDFLKNRLESMVSGLTEEAARYELIESDNERLRRELDETKMERDATTKTLMTILDERETLQIDLERITRDHNKTASDLKIEEGLRKTADKNVSKLQEEVSELDGAIAKIIEQTTVERENNSKNLQNLSEKFAVLMDEAASSIKDSSDQTDFEKLQKLKTKARSDK